MFRIYDKDLETAQKEKRAVQEIGSWKRLEVEFKRDVAQAIVELISKNTDSLEELMRSFVKQELNFIPMMSIQKFLVLGTIFRECCPIKDS